MSGAVILHNWEIISTEQMISLSLSPTAGSCSNSLPLIRNHVEWLSVDEMWLLCGLSICSRYGCWTEAYTLHSGLGCFSIIDRRHILGGVTGQRDDKMEASTAEFLCLHGFWSRHCATFYKFHSSVEKTEYFSLLARFMPGSGQMLSYRHTASPGVNDSSGRICWSPRGAVVLINLPVHFWSHTPWSGNLSAA